MFRSVCWRSPQQLQTPITPRLSSWLCAHGSLSRQLTQLSGGQFRVRLLGQRFARPTVDEARWLRMPLHQYAWIREVELYGCQAEPWVQARSVMPLVTLTGRGRRLRRLGSRSLGSLLFARQQPRTVRQVARLPLGWARRSRYVWHGQPLLVQECFLPAFTQFLAQEPSLCL